LRYRIPRLELFDEHGIDSQTVKALKLAILAVAFGIVNFNILNGIAMAGYLRELGASDFVFGLLFAIGPMASPMQLVAAYVLERTRKRKAIFLSFGLVQRFVWLPFGLVPFFVPLDHSNPQMRIIIAAVFMVISAFTVPFMNVSFHSWAADSVPPHIRGRYFAVRSRIFTIFGVAGGFLTAWLLDSFTGYNSFALVFALAAVMGMMDIACFIWVKFPPMPPPIEQGEKFTHMLGTALKNKPYMRFIAFMTIWMFSVNLSTPFILVHLREGVLLSNTLITFLIQILPNICSIMILTYWGRTIDTHGNKTVMQVANGLLCIAPFFWIFTTNNIISIVLIALVGLSQGLLLPGFDLGVNNMMLGHAPKENRSMYFAMYFMFTSIIGIGLANATGGWLLDNVFSIFETMELSVFSVVLTRYSFIFGLTAILRCLVVYVALPRMLHEENNTPVRQMLHHTYNGIRRMLARRRRGIRFRKRR